MPTTKHVLKPEVDDIIKNKDIAAVSYIWILSVIILYLRRDSHFVQFHARQGIVLFVLSVIFWIIPIIGIYLNILVVALMIIGFITAAQGEYYHMPIVYDFIIGEKKFAHIYPTVKKSIQYAVDLIKRTFSKIPKSKKATFTQTETPTGNEIVELEKTIEETKKQMKELKEILINVAERVEKLKNRL